MAVFLDSEIKWLDHIPSRVESVFLKHLTHKGRFCEVHVDRVCGKKPVGIWGWNTWCGIHDMTPLVSGEVHGIMRKTLDEGLSHTEAGTGLLPHCVPIDDDGRLGFRDGEKRVEYRTYRGIHGEDYCLDNIICWAKMVLEFFLYTRDRNWFTLEKLRTVERSTDFILGNLRSAYNPSLIESGIEGDWTENTNWHADNSNNNICMVQCLDQLSQVESIFGRTKMEERYAGMAQEIRSQFQRAAGGGGFWWDGKGYFLHGNDGAGQRIYGDGYFESTANYFSILWGVAKPGQSRRIWSYLDSHPEIEEPFPVLTNHLPRNAARRMDYGHTVTDGDVWLTLGAHAAVARLRSGYMQEATRMVKAIVDYELKEGTIHNNVYPDGTSNKDWSPEIGNYGSLFTLLVEGVLGLSPMSNGLLIAPMRLEGMNGFKTVAPLAYAGKEFYLEVSWKGGHRPEVRMDGRKRRASKRGYVLPPEFDDGCTLAMAYR